MHEKLNHLLANTFILYMKNFHVHWNMQDERFYFLHKMLEEHYTELAEKIDELAERIRQKEGIAPKSLKEILHLATLKECQSLESGQAMLFDLIETYLQFLKELQQAIDFFGKREDFVTQDLLIEYARWMEKVVWILKSHQN